MRYLLFFTLLSLSSGLLGQGRDSIALNGIPHNLFWENSPLQFSGGTGSLLIMAGEKTDMFRDPNVAYNTDNAPKLLFRPDENFVLTAAIEHAFASKWDGAALVIKADSLNWIKFCFEKDYTGAHRVVSVVTKGISDDCNSVEIKGNRVYYKIAKADNVITLYYSLTGQHWFLIRHLQFDAPTGLYVGFLAQSPTGKSCRARFTQIKYSSRKIKDPYQGE